MPVGEGADKAHEQDKAFFVSFRFLRDQSGPTNRAVVTELFRNVGVEPGKGIREGIRLRHLLAVQHPALQNLVDICHVLRPEIHPRSRLGQEQEIQKTRVDVEFLLFRKPHSVDDG